MDNVAIVISDPMDSTIHYECPLCGSEHYLEPDAGEVICEGCGEFIVCDVMEAIGEYKIDW